MPGRAIGVQWFAVNRTAHTLAVTMELPQLMRPGSALRIPVKVGGLNPGEDARILDGKRAIQIIRSRAAEWKLDPHRVGFIGFSAGSSLGRSVATASGGGDARADPVDRRAAVTCVAGLSHWVRSMRTHARAGAAS